MTHPDQSEQQLRRALGTMNDLQPPTDELFVQRAVIRGRARTSRRRNALVAAAAALVVVAGGGGAWLLQGALPGGSTASPASAPEVMTDGRSQSGVGSDSGASAGGNEAPTLSAGPDKAPAPATAGSDWFVGPMTPQRAAIEGLAPELTTAWASTFFLASSAALASAAAFSASMALSLSSSSLTRATAAAASALSVVVVGAGGGPGAIFL